MKYQFYEDKEIMNWVYTVPDFRILDDKYKNTYLDHLWAMSWEYIRKIVYNLKEVKKWNLEYYWFGSESIGVDVFAQKVITPKFKPYEWWAYYSKILEKKMNPVPFEDIYNLMKDYLEVIDEWEKRTWMEKPRW